MKSTNTNVMDVFIDSSVYIQQCYGFSNTTLSTLKKYCEGGIVHLLTNRIVKDEVKTNIYRDVTNAIPQIKNALLKQKCLLTLKSDPKFSWLFEDLSKYSLEQRIQDAWEEYLIMCNATIIDIDCVSIDSIFDKYFKCEFPFSDTKNKKAEFPDSIIIESIKKYADTSDNSIVVVTSDKLWRDCFTGTNIRIMDSLQELFDHISETNGGEAYKIVDEYVKGNLPLISDFLKTYLIEKQQMY